MGKKKNLVLSSSSRPSDVRVVLRACPCEGCDRELSALNESQGAIEIRGRAVTLRHTRVLGPRANQTELYKEVAVDLADQLLKGRDCYLVAAGSQLSGKSYSLHGELGEYSKMGLLPRVASEVLDLIEERRLKVTASISSVLLHADRAKDLLSAPPMRRQIKTSQETGWKVQGLQEVKVTRLSDLLLALEKIRRATRLDMAAGHVVTFLSFHGEDAPLESRLVAVEVLADDDQLLAVEGIAEGFSLPCSRRTSLSSSAATPPSSLLPQVLKAGWRDGSVVAFIVCFSPRSTSSQLKLELFTRCLLFLDNLGEQVAPPLSETSSPPRPSTEPASRSRDGGLKPASLKALIESKRRIQETRTFTQGDDVQRMEDFHKGAEESAALGKQPVAEGLSSSRPCAASPRHALEQDRSRYLSMVEDAHRQLASSEEALRAARRELLNERRQRESLRERMEEETRQQCELWSSLRRLATSVGRKLPEDEKSHHCLDALEGLIGDLEEEHAAAAAVRAEMEELRESVRVMSRTVEEKEKEAEELLLERNEAREDAARLSQQLDEAKERNLMLERLEEEVKQTRTMSKAGERRQEEQVEGLTRRLRVLEEELTRVREEADGLKKQLAEAEEATEALQAEVKEERRRQEDEARKSESVKCELQKMREEAEQLNKERRMLLSAQDEADSLSRGMQQLDKSLAEVTASLRVSEARREDEFKRAREAEQTILSLREERTKKELELRQMSLQLLALQEELRRSREKEDASKSKLVQLTSCCASAQLALKDLISSSRSCGSICDSMRMGLEKEQARWRELEGQLERLEDEAGRLQEERDWARRNLERERHQHADTRELVKQLQAKISALAMEVEERHRELIVSRGLLEETSGKKEKAEKNESLLREEMRVIEELMHEEVARRDLSLRELQQQHKELRSSHAALQRKTRELDEDNVRMRWQADELAGQLEGMATGAERKFRRAPLPEVEDLDLSPWRSLQGGGESCY